MLRTRKSCRLCGSASLVPVLSLGEQQLAGNFAMDPRFPPVTRRIPLELVRCDPAQDERACGLVQLRHTVPGDLMYTSYGYRSGINESMVRHLTGLARQIEARLGPLDHGELVVDIGANDGTLLSAYASDAPRYVGFEPSLVPLAPSARRIEIIRDYFSAAALARRLEGRRARVVTSVAMFYDLEDPSAFAADVAAVLDDEGLWVLELHYLPAMLAENAFDAICHEHLAYHSLSTLTRAIEPHGLTVIDAEENGSNGGSLRVSIARRGSRLAERPDDARARLYALQKRELELALDTSAPYSAFAERVAAIGRELPALLRRLKAEKKRVYGYGASTKGNVLLQYCGLGPELVVAIADRNPDKLGGKTVATEIPIISEDELREANPDYLLVLPWHFLEHFLARESALIARGTRFIVPAPSVRIVP